MIPRTSAAACAAADEVELVVCAGEATASRGSLEGALDLRLDPGRQREVLDGAAGRADQVVMMLGQVLGQLEAGELPSAEHPPNDSGLFEQREVAVGRALGQSVLRIQQLGDAQRPTVCTQGGHDLPPV